MGVMTLRERTELEAKRRQRATEALRQVLTNYARAHGGRFLLFGSAARGTMRYDSDLDLLVDFDDGEQRAAWTFAEYACWDRKLAPDIMPYAWCRPEFLAHIGPDLVVLG